MEGAVAGFEAVVGDDGAFLGEAFDVGGFLLEVAEGDEEGEVCVAVAGGLEHAVEGGLDALPDGVAGGLDDHAAADFGVLGEVGGADDLLIPLGEVLVAAGCDGGGRGGGAHWAMGGMIADGAWGTRPKRGEGVDFLGLGEGAGGAMVGCD